MNSSYRWVVLTLFVILAALSQFLWLNYAPLLGDVQTRFGVNESTAGFLLLSFPLLYVLFSIPAGRLLDRRGYRYGISLGGILMSIGATLRLGSPFSGSAPGPFATLLVAQALIAIGQPYVVNGISKLVLDWFPQEQGALATGLGTMGLFIGMAAGLAFSKPAVDSFGYDRAMGLFAIGTIVATLAFISGARKNSHPPSISPAVTAEPGISESLGVFWREKSFLKVFAIAFLGLGFFNGLTTWIEPILAPNGMNSIQAGNVGGLLILGGIFGAVVIPSVSDALKKRKIFLALSLAFALATIYPLCTLTDYRWVLALAALQGFFFLPAFALLLEVCAELAGQRRAGAATGMLMLAGNAGGVVVILGMEWIKGSEPTFFRAVLLMFALLAGALGICISLPETPGHSSVSVG